MPVIPFAQEGQRLNPSSPVPVGSSEAAAAPGENLAGFGQAMFRLGDALDQVARKAKDEDEKIRLTSALAEFRLETLRARAQRQAAPVVEGDDTGMGSVDMFTGALAEPRSRIAESLPEHLRQRFAAAADDIIADEAPTVYAKEIEKRVKVLDARTDEAVARFGGLAKLDTNELPESLKRAELMILENDNIPGSEKELRIRSAQQMILRDAVSGMADRKQYASAEVMLASPAYAQILDAEERDKLIEELRSKQWKDDSRYLQQIELEEKRAAKLHRAREANKVSYYSKALKEAGNSDIKRRPIIAQMTEDMVAGDLSEQKYRTLIDTGVFAQEGDDRYETAIMGAVLKEQRTVPATVDKVMQDAGLAVSYERANDIVGKLRLFEDRRSKDPNFNRLVQDAEQLIQSVMREDIMDALGPLEKRQREAKVRIAEGVLHRELLRNPNRDPMAIAKWILKDPKFGLNFDVGAIGELGYGARSKLDELSPEAIKEKRTRLAQDILKKKKEGKLTKPQEREFIKEDTRLKLKMEMMTKDREASSGGPAGAARGR